MKVKFSKLFQKKLVRGNQKISQAFRDRLKIFLFESNDPILNIHKLKGKYEGCKSFNVTGDYRAVFESITDDLVHFLDIDNHNNLYK